MAETRVPEKVVLPLTHTIFMARDTPPLGEIRDISVATALMNIEQEEEAVSCRGELAVDVAYHSKAGEGELHHAQINVPMTETLPEAWASVNANTSHITTENLSWQVLTTHALELVGTLVLTPAENKQRETSKTVLPIAADEFDELAEPPDDFKLNYVKPKLNSPMISETSILAELADDVQIMAELDDTVMPDENNGKREELIHEVSAELADDIMDGDLAYLEEPASALQEAESKPEPILETEDTMNYVFDEPKPISTVSERPYAVTESVGNEYRLKFYLPKKSESLEAVAAKPSLSQAAPQAADETADELENELFLDIPEENA